MFSHTHLDPSRKSHRKKERKYAEPAKKKNFQELETCALPLKEEETKKKSPDD